MYHTPGVADDGCVYEPTSTNFAGKLVVATWGDCQIYEIPPKFTAGTKLLILDPTQAIEDAKTKFYDSRSDPAFVAVSYGDPAGALLQAITRKKAKNIAFSLKQARQTDGSPFLNLYTGGKQSDFSTYGPTPCECLVGDHRRLDSLWRRPICPRRPRPRLPSHLGAWRQYPFDVPPQSRRLCYHLRYAIDPH